LQENQPLPIGNLIDRIVEMSAGVFLWVHLVVKSLLDGLTNHDDVQDLEARLTALPPELDALYKSILQSISPPFYKMQASKLLQIFYPMRETISSLALSFMDNPESPTSAGCLLDPVSLEVFDSRIKRVTDRLKSRCKGLIEVQSLAHLADQTSEVFDHPLRPDRVQYLHLTVKEFLEKVENWSLITDWTAEEDFDFNTMCSRGLLSLARRIFHLHGWGKRIATLFNEALFFARRAEESSGKSDLILLQDLDDLATAMFPHRDLTHWSSDFMGVGEANDPTESDSTKASFAAHAVYKGLTLYVESMSAASVQLINSESPLFLLSMATGSEPVFKAYIAPFRSRLLLKESRLKDFAPGPNSAMIKVLLDKGLSPNESRGHKSPWRELLEYMQRVSGRKPSPLNKYIDTTKLFILFGADLTCTFLDTDGSGTEKTAAEVLLTVFRELPRSATQDLFQMVVEGRQRQMEQREKAIVPALAAGDRPLEERVTAPPAKRKRKRQRPTPNSSKRRRRY
jgi:hypothetical protein